MHRTIAWFIDNPVAANLLMLFIMMSGLLGLAAVHKEEFPNIQAPAVSITVPYLGAAPEEVESGVCTRIEEAIQGLEGIEKINTTASEGRCSVMAELVLHADHSKALDDIKAQVNAISTFPANTERPIISQISVRAMVMQLAVIGDVDEKTLKGLTQVIRDDILELPSVSQVGTHYVRTDEISVEVNEQRLRQHRLTLADIAEAIKDSSIDIPGGSLKTTSREILLRGVGQRYSGEELLDIPVISGLDGTRLTLADVAKVVDGFEDSDLYARLDGKPVMLLQVDRVGEEDTVDIARDIKEYLAIKRPQLPYGVDIELWRDESLDLTGRLSTMINNAVGGLILVILTLALFLKTRLALWVSAGIPISILGAVALFPAAGLSISTLSLMGLLLSLGVLVDDAIVVGERIYAHEKTTASGRDAAIAGTLEVAVPVFFGVLTTMAAFIPVISTESLLGSFFKAIGYTVILCLVFSLIESQLILPAHLAHRKRNRQGGTGLGGRWERLQERLSAWLENLANHRYRLWLEKAIEQRYVTLALGTFAMIVIIGMMASGRIIFQFFPSVSGDKVYARLVLPEGTPIDQTMLAAQHIEAAAYKAIEEADTTTEDGLPAADHALLSVGASIARSALTQTAETSANVAEMGVTLRRHSERGGILATDFANHWRELTGEIPGVLELSFSASAVSLGADINIQLRGKDITQLAFAAQELRQLLEGFDGVYDISDSYRPGKDEIVLRIKPEAELLGLTQAELGRQVRHAFYGYEAQRVQRGRDDVRIMVRYPAENRASLEDFETMRIRLKDGTEVPILTVVDPIVTAGFSTIRRLDGQRIVNVTAYTERSIIAPETILKIMQEQHLPTLLQKHQGVTFSLAGEAEERAEALSGLINSSVIALMVIYTLLAIPLKSYLQPLVVMASIPFGLIGAIIGHYLLGYDLVFFSLLGIVALAGVVINASLVLVDYINRQRRKAGVSLKQAVVAAGVARFRPIFLTSLTTFVGLVPLMFTSDLDTAAFVPLAVSLGFGVIFATAVTLVLIPALYVVLDDLLCAVNANTAAKRNDNSIA